VFAARRCFGVVGVDRLLLARPRTLDEERQSRRLKWYFGSPVSSTTRNGQITPTLRVRNHTRAQLRVALPSITTSAYASEPLVSQVRRAAPAVTDWGSSAELWMRQAFVVWRVALAPASREA
jgi:hypothetical protein